MLKYILPVICLTVIPDHVFGHGMVMSPVNRASRWRFDDSAPLNYNDNELFCGGFGAQWGLNGGLCGLCGDNYADPTPRKNELGGEFGQGVIVKNYKVGTLMPVEVLITANHLGTFRFALCNLDKFTSESDECFDAVPLKFKDGSDKFAIDETVGPIHFELQLPEDLTCEHCVLQWTWKAGNSWGLCEDGQQEMGCGPQESFRTCSDIAIN